MKKNGSKKIKLKGKRRELEMMEFPKSKNEGGEEKKTNSFVLKCPQRRGVD